MNKGPYPEWMIYGMAVNDPKHPDIHVALYASNRLSVVDMERIFRPDYVLYPDGSVYAPTVEYIRLTAVMWKCTVIYAFSYVEALARLFNTWDPERSESSESMEIEPPRLQLEEGGG